MEGRSILRRIDWGAVLVILLAAAFRFAFLDMKPAHFDEGVNGWFVDQMTEYGYFRYDPENYHGPLHFYTLFVTQQLFGRNLWALRLTPVLVSLASIWLTLRFAPLIGRRAAWIAALCMAVSPAFTFYSRYAIHEAWVVFFLLLMLWGLLGLVRFGRGKHLVALVAGTVGMILTKETYVIHFGCFLLAGLTLWLWEHLFPSRPAWVVHPRRWSEATALWSLAGGIGAILFFYSGNFLFWESLPGLWKTHAVWFQTGVDSSGHAKTGFDLFGVGAWQVNSYWLWLGARYEWPFLLGLLACFRYLFPSRPALRFIAIYGGGTLLAYSLIPYKTPWCTISIFWPFYLVLGGLAEEWRAHRWVLPVVLLGIGVSAALAIRLNFFEPTNHREPYVYVQTDAEIRLLTGPLLEAAREDPAFRHRKGQVLLESYYPLPWILGDFTSLGYFKKGAWPERLDGVFVVTEISNAEEVRGRLEGDYIERRFKLRDAQEECIVFFRKDLFPNLAGRE